MSRPLLPEDLSSGLKVIVGTVLALGVLYALASAVGFAYVVGFVIVALVALWIQYGLNPRKWRS